jgi:hypothetical protein
VARMPPTPGQTGNQPPPPGVESGMRHDSNLTGRRWSMAAALLAVSACGFGDPPSSVRLDGVVFSDFKIDRSCSELTDPDQRPEELSGITLTFTNADGRVLGTTTGVIETEDLSYGGRFQAPYEIVVERSESYQVDFDPPEPRNSGGVFYDGANALGAQVIGFASLSDKSLTWDFEAPAQWVVP